VLIQQLEDWRGIGEINWRGKQHFEGVKKREGRSVGFIFMASAQIL
jgi:hypothetical protein